MVLKFIAIEIPLKRKTKDQFFLLCILGLFCEKCDYIKIK